MKSTNFTPDWAKDAVWYQIFPERFCNGDPANDPTLQSLTGSYPHDVSEPWQMHPWTSDWYARQPYEQAHPQEIWFHLQRRRYGGDLQGIINKLDYLQALGVNALYLNPVFMSPSSHKYDGSCYHHVDPFFGPNPQADLALVQSENPADPATWVWTSADRLLVKLVAEVHQRRMHIILDGVFNHLGLQSFAFKDLVKRGKASPYKGWFKILDWENPSQYAPFTYSGWFGNVELPEINQDENGITQAPRDYIFAATRRWMDPDGDGNPADGIDGWRLDVAFCIRHGFWKAWRAHVRQINPQAYMTAEIIYEDADEPYLQGDEFDAVMNYRWGILTTQFFTRSDGKLSVSAFDARLRALREKHAECVNQVMQNLYDSHDTARLSTHIINRGQLRMADWQTYHRLSRPSSNPAFDTRAMNVKERQLLKLMALFQMTYVGAPMIYYGTEVGMWGANDPCTRKPMIWQELAYDPETTNPDGSRKLQPDAVAVDADLLAWYSRLIHLRRENPALSRGDVTTLLCDDAQDVYAFERQLDGVRIIICLNAEEVARRVSLPVNGTWQDCLGKAVVDANAEENLPINLGGWCGMILKQLKG